MGLFVSPARLSVLGVAMVACGGGAARPEVPVTATSAAARPSTRRASGDVCADLAAMDDGHAALRQDRGDAIVLHYGTGLRADPEREQRLTTAAPGVEVGDFVVFEGVLVGPRRFLPMPVQGRSPELLARLGAYAIAGDPAGLEAGEVAVGRELAEVLGAGRGQTIGVAPLLPVDPAAPPLLEGTAAPITQRPGTLQRFRVAALLSFPANGILALDHDVIVMTLADAQRLWSESGAAPDEITGHILHFPDVAAAAAGLPRIREALSPDPFRVVPLAELEQGGQWTTDLVRRYCEGR